jgi:hypothetical protein
MPGSQVVANCPMMRLRLVENSGPPGKSAAWPCCRKQIATMLFLLSESYVLVLCLLRTSNTAIRFFVAGMPIAVVV